VSEPRELDLLVLGDLNPDLVLSGEEVEPAFGQVERLVDGAELTIGGSAGIMACGAARLGLRTAIVGVVGDDLFGRFMLDALAERGVRVDGVIVEPSLKTGLTVILSRPHDRAILTFSGAVAALRPSHVPRSLLRRARHVHVASFFLQDGLAEGVGDLFAEARSAGASTSLDPNWDPREQWQGGLHEALRNTDVFLPNAEEAIRITGASDAEAAARALGAGTPLVVIKLGAEGALTVRDGQLINVPPPVTVNPVDTTGAGDSFDAGMIAGVLAGWDVERALALACVCGALSTQGMGGTTAQPSRAEALDRLDEKPAGVAPGRP
jgi:sugar/nucleoside kinase (ribokinase family)